MYRLKKSHDLVIFDPFFRLTAAFAKCQKMATFVTFQNLPFLQYQVLFKSVFCLEEIQDGYLVHKYALNHHTRCFWFVQIRPFLNILHYHWLCKQNGKKRLPIFGRNFKEPKTQKNISCDGLMSIYGLNKHHIFLLSKKTALKKQLKHSSGLVMPVNSVAILALHGRFLPFYVSQSCW